MSMREEFEAWVRSKWPDTYLDRVPENHQLAGNYWEVNVQMNWLAWQASRETIEIQAPDDFTSDGNPNARILIAHHREIVGRWIKSIEDAGARVKP